MDNKELKIKYVGQIAIVMVLEMIMLLFRLVYPIKWPSQMSISWQNFGNEFIFFGIEFGLIVIIVGHFIFKYSFEALGLTPFKKNIVMLVINLGFIGICVGAAYLGSQFSKVIHFEAMEIILQVVINFIAIAWIRELVFRGFLFNTVLKLTDGKGIVASIITAILFSLTYIPNILLQLSHIQGMMVIGALVGPFLFGFYLCLLYYYGRNLWACTIIHGVCLTIASFEVNLFITLLASIYIVGLLIYLGYIMITYYRQNNGQEILEENIEKR